MSAMSESGTRLRNFVLIASACVCFSPWHVGICAQTVTGGSVCPRPSPASPIAEPQDLRSRNGLLHVDLTLRNEAQPDGSIRYCYMDAHGNQAPTLRVSPGDLVVLTLKNDLTDFSHPPAAGGQHHMAAGAQKSNPCAGAPMTSLSTNLHFHGLTIPPLCHQDDVLKTSIQPGDPVFEYRFRIPADEPPGLYWYHPHLHGLTKVQVLGGASGAIIVEGIERADKAVAGLPERVLIIRDQDLLNPNAPPSKSEPVVPRMLYDRDGDAANTGTGFGKPAKDLSLNFVPVPYPDYPAAAIRMKPEGTELWRVLNASAITYLDLEVLFDRKPQPLGLVALDGVPLNRYGLPADFVDSQTHLGVPPGSRVEFVVKGPPVGVTALFVTRTVDTGPGGENDTNRALATITASDDSPALPSRLSATPAPLPPPSAAWLGSVAPVITRRLYFSEKLLEPDNPNSASEFYITVDGQTPAPFDPRSAIPNIVARQGTVEDWIIENRSNELHAFHIHQLHFILLDYLGQPVNEPFLRDTVNVPYYDGKALVYPSVRLRMDFRDPNTVGDFVFHCHLLEHEDNGMMGLIRVEPAAASPARKANASPNGSRNESPR
jgi:FtsP/CotA-like multicopper oxidase with cupredoxin domain